MKFGILALDYDGTIAVDGMLDPGVRSAIEQVRGKGIVSCLVTGRILSDLRALMGDLRLFDCIVAENGAVVAFPNAGRSEVIGDRPDSLFLEELRRRKITFVAGECVIETDAKYATEVLEVIRDLELPLVMLFNRGRLMILPQAISKATGLRSALRTLRLSEHNAIAIGDAENDHQLLQACEIGLAVSWGSQALKATADGVLEGKSPADVADYIRQVAKEPKLPPRLFGRRRLFLGSTESGKAMTLSISGRNLLVAGDSQTGKSWVAGLICEQLILQHYCVCVIDAEGDYRTLEALPGVIVLGGDDPPPQVRDITRALRYPDVSIVLDLSKMRLKEKHDYVKSLLALLISVRRETGVPHRIVVDEAHYFLHEADFTRLLDLELAGYTLITYQASSMHPEILAATEAIIVTRESDSREIRALREMQGDEFSEAEWKTILSNLAINEAVVLPKTEEACGQLCKFHVAPRLTQHVRHQHKYLDMPLPESRAFVFAHNGTPSGRRARTLKEFASILAVTRPAAIDGHLRANDFSRWIAEVFRDYSLAAQFQDLEDEYKMNRIPDINDALIQLIQDRYKLGGQEVSSNGFSQETSRT